MRRLLICILFLVPFALRAQDFVSLLMEECKADTNLHCVTISPRMMEEIASERNLADTTLLALIEDLKSMRLLTAVQHLPHYFRKAEWVANRQKHRFEELSSTRWNEEKHRILIRRKDDRIVELVMFAQKPDQFIAVDFTGDMSLEFITRLRQVIRMEETPDL